MLHAQLIGKILPMTNTDKITIVLDTILLLLKGQIQEYPELKGEEGSIFRDEIKEKVLGVSPSDIDKIIWKLNEDKIIEVPTFRPELLPCNAQMIRDYQKRLLQAINNRIVLVLHNNEYLTIKGVDRINRSCELRLHNRSSKRLRILQSLAQNNLHRFTGEDLATFGGYSNGARAGKEFKKIFGRIEKDLGLESRPLYTSNNNGFVLKCSIEIVD